VPLTADNVVQENSGTGHTSGTSFSVSLPSGTTAGNTVLIFAGIPRISVASTGFTLDKSVANAAYVLRRSDVPASETSWTVTFANGSATDLGYSWYAVELSNVDLVEPLDASATNGPSGVANGGTLSTGTAPQNAALDTVAFAAYGVAQAVGTAGSWASYTNGFDEIVDLAPTTSPNGAAFLAVARRFPGATGQFETTGTLATTDTSPLAGALIVAYRSADSPIVAPLAMFAGFDWLTHGGITAAGAPNNMLGTSLALAGGTWGTNHLIQAGSARNSAGGLRIVCSASAAYVRIGNLNAGAGAKVATYGLNCRAVSSTGTAVVAEVLDNGTTTRAQIVYDTATTKFGVRAGTTGTISWESGTTPANTWRWIDLRVNTAGTTHTVDWRIETGAGTYAAQTSASLAGQTANTLQLMFAPGRQTTTQTMTADYDDVILSTYGSAFPLGPHEVKLLTVDPAGTPSVGGTSTNFNVFTANGTLGAWNAVNARNAVDDVPPTISASADGVVQNAVAASDYMEFPMATYTCGPAETIVGVRMLCPEWGGTGTGTGTIGYHGWDGTTDTTLIAAGTSYDADSLTALSTTYPRWACAMWQSVNGWTQAELDAAAVRVGYSTDATPDMGVHAVYLEVAIGPTRSQQLFGSLATLEADPNRGGTVSVTLDAPAGYDTDLYYEEGGSPTTVPVTGGTSATEQINAAFEPDVNYVAAYPAAEPDPVD
jgi:hypothetical protein